MMVQQTLAPGDATEQAFAETERPILEDSGVAFDPAGQYLDLTKDEKRRTTALMMAVSAYKELIIKDAEYLQTAADLARRSEGPKIQPATIDAMVIAAIKFDLFISGEGGSLPTVEIEREISLEAEPDEAESPGSGESEA